MYCKRFVPDSDGEIHDPFVAGSFLAASPFTYSKSLVRMVVRVDFRLFPIECLEAIHLMIHSTLSNILFYHIHGSIDTAKTFEIKPSGILCAPKTPY
jgi:hypothetical protein